MSTIEEPQRESSPHSDTWVKSYTYLRTAMVGLLLALGAAVFYQSLLQESLLSSVSAYYYTPAQAIFVGALIGLGACMIALKGTTPAEDVFLNLGGIFATVVAIVPTSRGQDYETAVRACREAGNPLLTRTVPADLDCPTVQALTDATRANVENNMIALLFVGALALIATWLFARHDWGPSRHADRREARWYRWGFGVAAAVWLMGLIAFWMSIDWFIDNAHYLAALLLFLCIVVVVVANADRRGERRLGRARGNGATRKAVPGALARYRYSWVAGLMLVLGGVFALLWRLNISSLFWLEIVVAALFVVFWIVQTIDLLPRRSSAGSASASRGGPSGRVASADVTKVSPSDTVAG